MIDCIGQVFHLRSRSSSYLMRLSSDGVLLHLYWGNALPQSDYSALEPIYWEGASFDAAPARQPFEFPTQELGYFGKRAVSCLNAQGDDVVSLRYRSHQILPGKPALDGLPSSYAEPDDPCQTLLITLTDPLTGLEATLSYTVWDNFDAIARSVRLTNAGAHVLTLCDVTAASVLLPGACFDAMHLNGAWARERHVMRAPLNQASCRIESRRGASGHEENPFMAVMDADATEFAGRVWAMALAYSGSFAAQADVDNLGRTRLSIGLNSEVFRWQLEPGATFQSPEALLAFSDAGLNGMSHAFHDLIRLRVCRGEWRDRPRPILINNWEATYFQFTPEKLRAIAASARDVGIELFVLDDGWFGKRDIDNCSLGDWVAHRAKLPDGIEGVCKDVNALGLQFGLWFEPEMISPDSDLYRAHPEWCLHVDGRPRTEMRQQLILDMGRAEVQAYVIEALSAVLQSAPIGYVKWDMNRNMAEAFDCTLPASRKLETQHRYMLGLYKVLDEITHKRFPHILFESCSGGGGRFDAGMLSYMPQTWTSDDTDANERVQIQYGTSMVYPPCTMGAHVSAVPNHQTGRTTGMKLRGDVAMGGNFGYELDLSKLSAADIEAVRAQVAAGKRLRPLMQKGRFTRLESPFTGDGAWQFATGEEALLFVYQRLTMPNPTLRRVYMRDLDAQKTYVADDGTRQTGAQLMYLGVPIEPARHDFCSSVWHWRVE